MQQLSLGDLSNILVMQTVSINKLLHSVEFKPTDDAMLHIRLERELHDLAHIFERICNEISKKLEEAMQD